MTGPTLDDISVWPLLPPSDVSRLRFVKLEKKNRSEGYVLISELTVIECEPSKGNGFLNINEG